MTKKNSQYIIKRKEKKRKERKISDLYIFNSIKFV